MSCVSTAEGDDAVSDGPTQAWRIDMCRLPHLFTGTGDLFTALLLAHMHRSNGDLPRAMERTIDTLQAVLRTTAAYAESRLLDDPDANCNRLLELRLIQSKKDIEEPPQTFTAHRLSP